MNISTVPSPPTIPNEPGYVLGASLIGLLLVLFIACIAFEPSPGRLHAGFGTVLLGVYILTWGVMFLAAYYFSHKSFFLRGLIWVCEHLSHPAGRKMAFFYFALAAFLGSMGVLKGLGVV
jgi:hypothetical protein